MELKENQDLLDLVFECEKNILIDFYANWCRPCKQLEPVLEEICGKFKNLNLIKINVDHHGYLAEKFNIRSIPALRFIYFKNVSSRDIDFYVNNSKEIYKRDIDSLEKEIVSLIEF